MTGQYYLHLFHRKQPDLNWRNPRVREAMYDAMRFWFARGIDGFRIDVLWLLIKDAEFADNPPPRPLQEGEHEWGRYDRPAFEDLPEVMEIVHEMRAVSDEFEDRVLIGEIYLPVERLMRYYGESGTGIHLPFNFGLVTTYRWDAQSIGGIVDAYERALPHGAWPNWVLGNHDVSRTASRLGPERARLAQMLLLTLRGTPTCYYGDELGMLDPAIPAHRIMDPQAAIGQSRDPSRTPMQWDDSPTAGFAPPGTTPWLPVGEDAAERNVIAESADPRSPLSLFRALMRLRTEHPSLALGTYRRLANQHTEVLCYLRQHGDERIVVALNFGSESTQVDLSEGGATGEIVCSTYMDRTGNLELRGVALRPAEGVVARAVQV